MAWQDRVKEGAYEGPDGTRVPFGFTSVSQETEKRTSEFGFPDADGTLVQDLGRSGRRFPIRAFFNGADHDIEASGFEAVLWQRGRGRLEHPFYGTFTVVPTGQITRRDDLVSAANQTVVEVTFTQTIAEVYPAPGEDPADEVDAALREYNEAAPEQFANDLDLDAAGDRARFKGAVKNTLSGIDEALGAAADTVDDIQREFNAIADGVDAAVDVLVQQPLNLGFQIQQLIQSPSREVDNITARLDAYSDLAESMISGRGARVDPRDPNDLIRRDFTASGAVSGMVAASVNYQYQTRPEAVESAERLLDELDTLAEWRDENYNRSRSMVDSGAVYQKLQRAVAAAAGGLIEISFSLIPERVIVLDRPRTPIDLAAELYGSVDDRLDFLARTNSLSATDMLEIPRGRRIVYYPDN